MAVQAGIENLEIFSEALAPEATIAVGSLVRVTHQARGKFDKRLGKHRTDEQVFHGEIKQILVSNIELPITNLEGKYVGSLRHRVPVIHLGGHIILESVNNKVVFQEVPDRIIYGTDTSYQIEPISPIQLPEQR